MRPKPTGGQPAEHPFSVVDSGYDDLIQPDVPAGVQPAGAGPDPQPAPRADGRWAIAALALAVLAVIAAGALQHHRARPSVQTKVVRAAGLANSGLSGCPVDRPCAYGSLTDSSLLLPFVQQYLPGARELSSSVVFDGSSAEFYRGLLVAALPSGVTVTVEVDFDPTTTVTIPAWRSPLPPRGPADVQLVATGTMSGSSVSVSAHVPAGVPVPVEALQRLVTDQNLQRPQS